MLRFPRPFTRAGGSWSARSDSNAEAIKMATFVLVHGAFGSPAELAPVIPWLEALGHRAIAVDLPCTDPSATLDDYAVTVIEAMAGIDGPVVVVGHSAGGATISLVPGRTRVDRLVYVTAVVPEPGRSIADVLGDGVRETILSVSRDDGNGCRSFDLEMLASIAPPDERDAYLAFLRATQRSQGWAAVEQPWPGRSLPDVPCAYVLMYGRQHHSARKAARDGGAPGCRHHRNRLGPFGLRPQTS